LAELVRLALAQWQERREIFGLPQRRFFRGFDDVDLSVTFHGKRAQTPVGPASGPHTQMAQNIVLSYLAGARILELKTVQVRDRLAIARPCIDMATVGYNVEWSQELLVEESLREYAKAWLLIAILRELGVVAGDCLFDVSVGYDLAGIRSAKVTGFLRVMQDATMLLDGLRLELRRGLPVGLRALADVPAATEISNSVTLSTFHGCPRAEIQAICEYLLTELGLHVVVKMNPTLLGLGAARTLLQERLGYEDVHIHAPAFANDPSFAEGVALLDALIARGRHLGLSVGAKFSNTLVVENRGSFLPASEKVMYLSGRPLFPLAFTLAAKFRRALGRPCPISFSAGIDAVNYPIAVAAGLTPITTCSVLLAPGGYGRLHGYHGTLRAAMLAADATSIAQFIGPDPLAAHERSAAAALDDPRYHASQNKVRPKKIGSHLTLFDCINCDKCIPVCPNNANFSYELAPRRLTVRNIIVQGDAWRLGEERTLEIGTGKRPSHQIANEADLCNDCGNCDVFCPEDGGPYIEKPRLFSSGESFLRDSRPGFWLQGDVLRGRWGNREQVLTLHNHEARYYDGVAELLFDPGAAMPREVHVHHAVEMHEVDVGFAHAMWALFVGLRDTLGYHTVR
jgi:putative selenate reductase